MKELVHNKKLMEEFMFTIRSEKEYKDLGNFE
jgi:hypothetical protein